MLLSITLDWWEAILMGIIQGLTEFLPVSSSGHLELVKAITTLDWTAEQSLFFTVLLHFATACSTLLVFRKDVLRLTTGVFRRDKESVQFIIFIILSMIPAGIVGFAFEEQIEMLFAGQLLLVGVALIITGVLLIMADRTKQTDKNVGTVSALIVGIAQAVAIIPGISRSGATIATSIMLKINRDDAARFSFLMVIPVILGKTMKDLLDVEVIQDFQWSAGFLGFVAAFITGVLACTWMIRLVRNSKLIYFAVYCWVVGTGAILWQIYYGG